ncbi:nucleotide-diphospho-sugar transferase [Blastocladiella britannica]|nr:nucleotide-diphospho-sugar transferase [Blastocladiella britannica]
MVANNNNNNTTTAAAALEEDPILQAVVVADSFDSQFAPLSADLPRCLLPLCNVPLIEYTLECLALAQVTEVFIVCCAHSDLIKSYILNSHWNTDASPMAIHVIVSRSSLSMGDVLRELDTKQLIKADFILVSGDVISNLRLDAVVAAHRARKLADKNTVMTMVLKSGSPFHGARGPHALFCLDPAQHNKCLQYLPLDDPRQSTALLLPDMLDAHRQIVLRNDFIDCGIDICTVEVLALFSENFDYQDLRADFVRGILESDLFVKSIYTHEISDDYAIRVRNTQLYDRVSLDLMRRWVFPLVPDANALGPLATTFTHSRANIYREKPVFLSRTTVLVKNVVLGQDTTVGQGTVLANCVVGRNCKLGRNVALSNAYLWDNTVLGDGVSVMHAILAHHVTVRDKATISRGCILGQGVVIGQGISLPEFTRVTRPDEGQESDESLVGPDGVGVRWVNDDDYDDYDDEDAVDPQYHAIVHDIGHTPEDLRAYLHDVVRQQRMAGIGGLDDDEPGSGSDEEEDKEEEVRATIQRALQDGHTLDNALIELSTLKFACNMTFGELREIVVPEILDFVFVANSKNFKALLERWAGVWGGLIHQPEDQVELLELIEEWFGAHLDRAKFISTVAMVVYEADIVEDGAFTQWFDAGKRTRNAALQKVIAPFIDWLEEDDEDEDDESGSEEEDDE